MLVNELTISREEETEEEARYIASILPITALVFFLRFPYPPTHISTPLTPQFKLVEPKWMKALLISIKLVL